MKFSYKCKRGHVSLRDEYAGDVICCPQVEMSSKHRYYGKVCGRLAFDIRNPQGLKTEKDHEQFAFR